MLIGNEIGDRIYYNEERDDERLRILAERNREYERLEEERLEEERLEEERRNMVPPPPLMNMREDDDYEDYDQGPPRAGLPPLMPQNLEDDEFEDYDEYVRLRS